MSMIPKDMIWHNDHHQQANWDLTVLQQQLFNQKGLKEISIMEKVQTIEMMWNKKEMKNGTTW